MIVPDRAAVSMTCGVAFGVWASVAGAPVCQADSVAYLVNVTMRPGYNFGDAGAALDYGYGICDRVAAGAPYADAIATVKGDFSTGDEYQAAYLINQAVNELCPAMIWQLRRSAAHYTGSPNVGG